MGSVSPVVPELRCQSACDWRDDELKRAFRQSSQQVERSVDRKYVQIYSRFLAFVFQNKPKVVDKSPNFLLQRFFEIAAARADSWPRNPALSFLSQE